MAKAKKKASKQASKKTTKKVARYTAEDVEAMIAKAAEKARQDGRREAEEEFEYEQEVNPQVEEINNGQSLFMRPSNIFETDEQEPHEEISAGYDFDIFTYIHENFHKKGVPINYSIKKDGEIIGTLSHPYCNWDLLQKKYGGGNYTVFAKRKIDGRFVKQQTEQVAPPLEEPKPDMPPQPQIIQPQSPQLDPNMLTTQMIKLFNELQAMNRQDKSREERDERRGNESLISMISNTQNNTQNLILKMQENTTSMMDKINDNTSRMIERVSEQSNRQMEKLEDRFSKIIENLSKKNENNLDSLKLISLIRDGEERGIAQFTKIMELAEMKAESMRESNDEPKDSLLSKALTSLLPLISNASSMAQQQVMQQQQMAMQPGRSLNRPSAVRPVTPNPGQKTQPGRAQTANTVRPIKAQTNPEIQDSSKSSFSGLETSKPKKYDTQRDNMLEPTTYEPEPELAEGEEYIDVPSQESEVLSLEELTNNATEAQMGMVSTALPIITSAFETKASAESTASNLFAALKQNSYQPKQIVEEFNIELVVQLAKSLGVDDNESINFLRSMYASLEQLAKKEMANIGASEQSQS
jgi:hypothetical protein